MNLGMCWCRARPQTYRYGSLPVSLYQRRGIADRAEENSRANGAIEADVQIQTFTDALGGAAAEPITNTNNPDRPFQVGDSTFV